MKFEATYQPLSHTHPEWGEIALLPWDAEIFGFPVADYKMGNLKYIAETHAAFREALVDWASRNSVELVSCTAAADATHTSALLQNLGFKFVDSTVYIVQTRVQKTTFPTVKMLPRLAEEVDRPAVERIAEHAFRFGRYYADPRFPRDLVERRYRYWLANAFAAASPTNRIYVVGEPGRVGGFAHFEIEGHAINVTILAAEKSLQGGIFGYNLCAGLMNAWKSDGIVKVVGKASAANMPMLNMALNFGFRLADPQIVFHWHAPDAPHLIALGSALARGTEEK